MSSKKLEQGDELISADGKSVDEVGNPCQPSRNAKFQETHDMVMVLLLDYFFAIMARLLEWRRNLGAKLSKVQVLLFVPLKDSEAKWRKSLRPLVCATFLQVLEEKNLLGGHNSCTV